METPCFSFFCSTANSKAYQKLSIALTQRTIQCYIYLYLNCRYYFNVLSGRMSCAQALSCVHTYCCLLLSIWVYHCPWNMMFVVIAERNWEGTIQLSDASQSFLIRIHTETIFDKYLHEAWHGPTTKLRVQALMFVMLSVNVNTK